MTIPNSSRRMWGSGFSDACPPSSAVRSPPRLDTKACAASWQVVESRNTTYQSAPRANRFGSIHFHLPLKRRCPGQRPLTGESMPILGYRRRARQPSGKCISISDCLEDDDQQNDDQNERSDSDVHDFLLLRIGVARRWPTQHLVDFSWLPMSAACNTYRLPIARAVACTSMLR